jgi:hypothetical protein
VYWHPITYLLYRPVNAIRGRKYDYQVDKYPMCPAFTKLCGRFAYVIMGLLVFDLQAHSYSVQHCKFIKGAAGKKLYRTRSATCCRATEISPWPPGQSKGTLHFRPQTDDKLHTGAWICCCLWQPYKTKRSQSEAVPFQRVSFKVVLRFKLSVSIRPSLLHLS